MKNIIMTIWMIIGIGVLRCAAEKKVSYDLVMGSQLSSAIHMQCAQPSIIEKSSESDIISSEDDLKNELIGSGSEFFFFAKWER